MTLQVRNVLSSFHCVPVNTSLRGKQECFGCSWPVSVNSGLPNSSNSPNGAATSAPVVVSMNYVTMAAALGVFHLFRTGFDFRAATVQVGMITGAAFVSSMFIMTRALRNLSVAPVLTAFRMSVVIPVILSVQIWGEEISFSQAAGVGSALLAVGLMARGAPATTHVGSWIHLCLVPVVFCAQGVSHSCLRWVHYAGLDDVFVQCSLCDRSDCRDAGLGNGAAAAQATHATRTSDRGWYRAVQPDCFNCDSAGAWSSSRHNILSRGWLYGCRNGPACSPLHMERTVDGAGSMGSPACGCGNVSRSSLSSGCSFPAGVHAHAAGNQ